MSLCRSCESGRLEYPVDGGECTLDSSVVCAQTGGVGSAGHVRVERGEGRAEAIADVAEGSVVRVAILCSSTIAIFFEHVSGDVFVDTVECIWTAQTRVQQAGGCTRERRRGRLGSGARRRRGGIWRGLV